MSNQCSAHAAVFDFESFVYSPQENQHAASDHLAQPS
jgi:hypothetical protein